MLYNTIQYTIYKQGGRQGAASAGDEADGEPGPPGDALQEDNTSSNANKVIRIYIYIYIERERDRCIYHYVMLCYGEPGPPGDALQEDARPV